MTAVKICGLRHGEDIWAVNRYLPEFAGFVFAKSRRQVSADEAEALVRLLDARICPVGVFVNANPDEICELVRRGVIRAVQLHGQEDIACVRALREKLDTFAPGTRIIKALSVKNGREQEAWQESAADCLLLDAGAGGTGQAFDHSLLTGEISPAKPWFLAGGMNPENAAAAIRRFSPYAIDCSSGVETEGVKDPEKIRAMIAAVRQTGQQPGRFQQKIY